jgi:hypothetical protein
MGDINLMQLEMKECCTKIHEHTIYDQLKFLM